MKRLIVVVMTIMGVALVAATAAMATQEPEFVCPPPGVVVESSETVNNQGGISNGHTHYVCIIPGEKGTDGEDGEDGTNGTDGQPGPQGPAGPQGPKGDTGNSGNTGTGGASGRDGANGVNGSNGSNGRDGRDGVNGKDGLNGLDADICANLEGRQANAPVGKYISLNPRGQLVCVSPALAKQFAKARIVTKLIKVTKLVTVTKTIKALPKPDNPPVRAAAKPVCKPGFAFSKKYGCTAKVEGSG